MPEGHNLEAIISNQRINAIAWRAVYAGSQRRENLRLLIETGSYKDINVAEASYLSNLTRLNLAFQELLDGLKNGQPVKMQYLTSRSSIFGFYLEREWQLPHQASQFVDNDVSIAERLVQSLYRGINVNPSDNVSDEAKRVLASLRRRGIVTFKAGSAGQRSSLKITD